MANDRVTAHKLTDQSGVSFSHIAKTLHNLSCDVTLTKRKALAKQSKLLCQATSWYILRTDLIRQEQKNLKPVTASVLKGKNQKHSMLCFTIIHSVCNRRFPEITGKDNLTVFSYSGRVKSPEWRWQLRRADLRQF